MSSGKSAAMVISGREWVESVLFGGATIEYDDGDDSAPDDFWAVICPKCGHEFEVEFDQLEIDDGDDI